MKEILINSEEQFEDVIEDGVILVDFYASWCGPCKMLAPFIEEIAEEYEGKVKVCKVDVDEVGTLAQKFNVHSIPTLMYFKDGKLKDVNVGFQDKKAIESVLEKYIKA